MAASSGGEVDGSGPTEYSRRTRRKTRERIRHSPHHLGGALARLGDRQVPLHYCARRALKMVPADDAGPTVI
jgi:hypothetical protein